MDKNQAVEALEKLSAAMHARSAEQVEALYDDDIVVWHGSTRKGQSKVENVGLLASVFKLASYLEYKNVRRHALAGEGAVQQHTLVGTFADGKAMPDLEACLVVHTKNGRIARIDEYFDGNQYAEVWAKLGAS